MNTRYSITYAAAASFRWRLPKATAALPRVLATALAGSLWAATAQADPLIVGHAFNGDAGGTAILTYDFAAGGAPVASFVPTGASDGNGRGVAVLGNRLFYTVSLGLVTPSIEVAPFNGGTGGADFTTLPNPRPGGGVRALAVANGVLYALTEASPGGSLQVFGLDPITGAVVSGPVTITGPAGPGSDGFTVLPNGNFLINSTSGPSDPPKSCTYNQFNPSTGAVIPATTITLAQLRNGCSGVTTNGVHLFFETYNDSFTETDLTGFKIATKPVTSPSLACNFAPSCVMDISLVTFGASGVPGKPSCVRKTIRDLKHQYGNKDEVLSALCYSSVAALKSAIDRFCDTP